MRGTLVYAGVLSHNAFQPRSHSRVYRGQGCVGVTSASASRLVVNLLPISKQSNRTAAAFFERMAARMLGRALPIPGVSAKWEFPRLALPFPP